ncbi:ankyrin repeat domain-containing protein [Roseibium sediminicola]|uniref:Ankyrin repeat domain-containing protein n=1 Tax=Roseibium sediminicola TaxID=2933272 RepID=A0ABT0GNR9_9HYPH|nr:ankyrin repeat domain-containing protein [Roseibium sp. CAU 1639]MCK7610890.1 ankyrin repeat domain-containing protein [Roseibium sp. CAU 1639]
MSDGPATSLDTYKKSARRLRKAYSTGDANALARVAAHADPAKGLRHADFLHVIAREEGHDSWPKLKFALESAAMTRAEKAERLKMALYHGQHWITEKLLADDPALRQDNLGLQIALYDLDAVRAAIDADPAAATALVGIRSPILHLAFSKDIHRRPDRQSDMLAIAELLVAHGADVNDGYPPEPGADHALSALYGALCHADNFELGRWFLEKGADPNDNESLYHSTELGHTRALELLLKHGARPDGTNALPRALDFDDIAKVRLLLEAGADPNITEPDHPSGLPMNTIPALHQAARRDAPIEVAELLLQHGADATAVWDGHTPHAMALIYGNRPVADFLAANGYARPLNGNEAILAACAENRPLAARLDTNGLSEEDRGLLTRLAFIPGKLDHMKALVSAGLDPDVPDSMGLPPLHVAGWNGLVEELRYFLSLGPDLTRKNGFGGDALDTVVHGSEFAPKRPEADHITCARLLLEAGSVLDPRFIAGCGNPDMVAFLEDWLQNLN